MKKYISFILLCFCFVFIAQAQQTPSRWTKETALRGKGLAGYSQESGNLKGYLIDSVMAQSFGIYPTPVSNVLATGNAINLRSKIVPDTIGRKWAVDFYGNSTRLDNNSWSLSGNAGATAFLGKTDSSALTFKINGATGFERMKIGQNDFMYKSHTNTNRLEINQSGAALRGDTSASFSYNLYAGVYKNIKPGATSSEGIWVDQYFFGNKGDSITATTGNNNNGIFVGKIRKKASWMGLGTAPDSGYIAGASGLEIIYGHGGGGSEDARTGTVKGINLYPYQLSGYIGNQYAIYLQTNNSNNARVTGKNYGIFMESGASGWINSIQGSTAFGTATPQGVIDVQSTTQFAYPLPRMTTAQRNAITPQAGAMLFNTDTNKVQVYASSVWQDL